MFAGVLGGAAFTSRYFCSVLASRVNHASTVALLLRRVGSRSCRSAGGSVAKLDSWAVWGWGAMQRGRLIPQRSERAGEIGLLMATIEKELSIENVELGVSHLHFSDSNLVYPNLLLLSRLTVGQKHRLTLDAKAFLVLDDEVLLVVLELAQLVLCVLGEQTELLKSLVDLLVFLGHGVHHAPQRRT